ncbi:type IV pilus twitching motility protein PilT [Patescibacteria group bacterium]|nr:type IV pilus twitching motility protein PilT [Patescibacteria group bacterium]MBU1500507.1 type IV pilus twitching motility protein PilT [Patescibacteria group bacterium]MBU2080694.1 type IV pilus twitching motility protein PilT [Patescibacteria group bacterium]MBU2123799.1 type IV pilus twitching motility protein PilT [Patescibacteria group bacterium]MBU2194910.1 type IV pilus twitching motility protein PilT [Patescibacteria group bacterium]
MSDALSSRLGTLLDTVVAEDASDLHLSAGNNPILRISGSLVPLLQQPPLTPEETKAMLQSLLPPDRWQKFEQDQATDFSYAHGPKTRFRVNGYTVQGAVTIAMRLIPHEIRTFQDLGLPPILEVFSQRSQGFFLVVGPVGQGKSTTLATIIDRINETRAEHILTIEDPIEYIFEQKKSLIHQREVHIDAPDFHSALNSAFREDVNVIMVGEMRNQETISSAVTAAETGHLVLSTLHTNNAAQTIDRIIDMFPPNQQDQVRVQLAGSLAGIFSQRLIPRISGGQLPAYELLINNSAISNLIREGRTHEITTVIQTSSQEGMIDMDRSLAELVRRGEVTIENAYERANDPKTFERYL